MLSSAHAFRFHGCDLIAYPSGALFWPEQDLLVVSDLHLEKASSRAPQGGALLPPYDSLETLAKLSQDLAETAASTVICLGDSFHDKTAASRLHPEPHKQLCELMANRRWIWILGNHDPLPPEGLEGEIAEHLPIGPLIFRHIAETLDLFNPGGEVSGHYHPKAHLPLRGKRVTGPCFVFDEHRLIMPAYGAFTGGLSVRDPAISKLMQAEHTVLLTAATRVVPVPGERLRA